MSARRMIKQRKRVMFLLDPAATSDDERCRVAGIRADEIAQAVYALGDVVGYEVEPEDVPVLVTYMTSVIRSYAAFVSAQAAPAKPDGDA